MILKLKFLKHESASEFIKRKESTVGKLAYKNRRICPLVPKNDLDTLLKEAKKEGTTY